MIAVTDIWRYPIKGIGRERIDATDVTPDNTLPQDRLWAVAHEAAQLEPGWNPCRNFARGASAPLLQAITARTEADDRIALAHPDRPDITLSLPTDAADLLAWLAPLWPDTRPPLTGLHAADTRALTDSPEPSISIMNQASLRAFNQKSGFNIGPERFRGNIWIDGAAPWEEHDWIDRTITIGTARLRVDHPINRCMATHANTITGQRDADVLGHLNKDWGHQFFGVNVVVETAGHIATGDELHP